MKPEESSIPRCERPARVKDLVGETFGRLTVTDYWGVKVREYGCKTHRRHHWLCTCECGSKRVIAGASLKKGNTKSCGCLHREVASERGRKRAKNLVGKTFGRWTVIKFAGSLPQNCGEPRKLWLCECECGSKRVVCGSSLPSGRSKSCGCLNRELVSERAKKLFTTHGLSGSFGYFKAWVANQKAKKLGLAGRLTPEQVNRLFEEHGYTCNYCGKQSDDSDVMTLDHIVPFAKGGRNEILNCVPACCGCNRSKFTKSLDDWSVN